MVLKTYFKEYLDKKTYKQYDLYRDTQFYLTFFFFLPVLLFPLFLGKSMLLNVPLT